MVIGGKTIKQGDFITLDGSAGEIYSGDLPLKEPELPVKLLHDFEMGG